MNVSFLTYPAIEERRIGGFRVGTCLIRMHRIWVIITVNIATRRGVDFVFTVPCSAPFGNTCHGYKRRNGAKEEESKQKHKVRPFIDGSEFEYRCLGRHTEKLFTCVWFPRTRRFTAALTNSLSFILRTISLTLWLRFIHIDDFSSWPLSSQGTKTYDSLCYVRTGNQKKNPNRNALRQAL
jgi:hypothetical protein